MNEDELQKYKVHLEVKHRKRNTRLYYHNNAKLFLEYVNKPLKQITKQDINKYIAHLNKSNLKPNTIVSRIITMDNLLSWSGKKKLRAKIPTWQPYYRDTITLEEIQKIRNTARKHSIKDYLLILFITDLDARDNEICKAKFSNIKGEKYYFDDTKTGNNYGFVTPEFLWTLEQYKKIRPTPKLEHADYIFIKTNGEKYGDKGTFVRTTVTRINYLSKLGRKLRPYDLRASVITEEFNNYVNPKVIQRKARHKRLKTTERYNHVDDDMVRDYVNNGLIFNEGTLYNKNRKKDYIKHSLSEAVLPKDLNKDLENDSYSFSIFSFSEQPLGDCLFEVHVWRNFSLSDIWDIPLYPSMGVGV